MVKQIGVSGKVEELHGVLDTARPDGNRQHHGDILSGIDGHRVNEHLISLPAESGEDAGVLDFFDRVFS